MTQFLPPNLLALFAPRDPIPFLPPCDKLPWERKRIDYTGISNFVEQFENPEDTPPPTRVETREERLERRRKEKAEQVNYKLEQDLALWDPEKDSNSTGDPYKTLFVARVNYDTSESKIRREFESYGPIRQIRCVYDKISGKPRGYCFIEYDHERDMHTAYKRADGRKIDGRRVVVDVERGRTVKGWRPRRLGGGLGGTRRGPPEMCTRHSGRDDGRSRDRSSSRDRRRHSRSRDRYRSRDRRSRDRDRRDRRSRDRDRRERRSRDRDRRSSRDRDRHRSRDRGESERDSHISKKSRPNEEMNGEVNSGRY